ncbi:MAG TPA: type II secretion system protein [Candidatus Limnocylindria bacterium]|jgi:prepilin-type N-terminal cleavage/methylation domain-containing protein|nr:type II secretion system protein [Candidatus Limnocylindria bacterium]
MLVYITDTSGKRRRRRAAFTLIEIMIVVMIMGLLALVAIPNVKKYLGSAKYQSIIANLKAIELAKLTWGNESRKGDDAVPTETDLDPYFGGGHFPAAIAGEVYHIGSLKERPTATAGTWLSPTIDTDKEIALNEPKQAP